MNNSASSEEVFHSKELSFDGGHDETLIEFRLFGNAGPFAVSVIAAVISWKFYHTIPKQYERTLDLQTLPLCCREFPSAHWPLSAAILSYPRP